MQSAAAPGNQTLIQTNLIHAGFARQLICRQDVADPVCWRLNIPLFSVTSMSCRVSERFPLGWPHAARHHSGWFYTNRPTIIPLQMAVSCAGDQGCCFHGSTYTIPLVSSPTIKIQTKINLESDFSLPTCWPFGGPFTLCSVLEPSSCHCGFSHRVSPELLNFPSPLLALWRSIISNH